MTTGIKFALLGPLRASVAGQPLELGPARERALLAVLLCRANEVVGAAELLDAVWGDTPPGSGQKVIATYIYRLRKSMAATEGAARIDSGPDGYVLRTEPENLDTTVFERTVALARARREAGELDGARSALVDALALCRGVPFAGLPGVLLAAQRRRWEEKRLAVLEERIELDLRGGRHAALIAELETLRGAHPWRERFAALLMVALYRSGRQAEALAVYENTRGELREALGVDPGAELSATHQAVLCCDEQLIEPAAPATTPLDSPEPSGWRPRRDLPAEPIGLLGRDAEVQRLVETGGGVLTIDGMPGVGKTALGLHVAHRLAALHTDGALYLDLAAAAAPGEALRRLLRAVGVAEQHLPEHTAERAALWRGLLAEHAVLLYLDNATSTDQVLPLLPGEPGCTVLISGRNRLAALPLSAPVTESVTLHELDRESARRLLGQRAGERALVDEPAAAHDVLSCCAGLPAAIVLAAGVLRLGREPSVAGFAARLADPFAALRVESLSLASIFHTALAALSEPARRALAALPAEEPAAAERDELIGASLARVEGARLRVHPLLARYVSGLRPAF